jgi:peroxiredoxin Q/BCP
MRRLQIGDSAPDFTWVAPTGTQTCLSDFRHQKVVVLFFYPRDGSAICTREACAFRDAYDQFSEAGAVVVGISGDSAQSHSAFAARHNLPFYLVSDADGSIRKSFGVSRSFGLLPGRVTYVIDSEGVVRLIFSSQLTADRHVSEALRVVQELVRASK